MPPSKQPQGTTRSRWVVYGLALAAILIAAAALLTPEAPRPARTAEVSPPRSSIALPTRDAPPEATLPDPPPPAVSEVVGDGGEPPERADAPPPLADPSLGAAIEVTLTPTPTSGTATVWVNPFANRSGGILLHERAPGVFSQSGFVPGQWFVFAHVEGHADVEERLELEAGDHLRHHIQLEQAVTASGRVVDGSGHGVPHATLHLMNRGQFMSTRATAETDSDGRFSFEAARAGPFHLLAMHPDFAWVRRNVDLPASDLDFVLGAGIVVRGRIVGVEALETLEATASLRSVKASARESTLTGGVQVRDGRFAFDVEAPGDYDLRVRVDGFATYARRLHITESLAIDVALDIGKTIRGIVVGDTGTPVAGAKVDSIDKEDMQGGQSATTDANGHFVLNGLVEGEVPLWVTAAGYAKGAPQIHTVGDNSVRLVLPGRSARVRGRVIDARGRPVTRFFVELESYESADGTFEQDTEGVGEQRVSLRGAFEPREFRFTAVAGKTHDLGGIVVVPKIVLKGTLLAAGTRTLHDCTVEAVRVSPGAEEDRRDANLEGANYSVGLTSAAYRLRAHCDEGWAIDAAQCPSGTCQRDIRLEPGGTLRVHVADAASPRLTVTCAHARGDWQDFVWLDAAGTGLLPGLPPGRCIIGEDDEPGTRGIAFDVVAGREVTVAMP